MKNILENKIVENIKNIKEQPIYGMYSILSLIMVITSTIAFIIAYVSFIINGGYKIKSDDLFNFTDGNVEKILYSKVVLTIVTCCFIIGIILTFILFFKNSKKNMRILMIVALSFVFFSHTLEFLFYFGINKNIYLIPVTTLEKIYKNIDKIVAVMICIRFITLIGICVLIKLNYKCDIVKYIFIAGAISLGILPLSLLILENIVAIVSIILAIAFVGLILFLLIMAEGSSKKRKKVTIKDEDGHVYSEFEIPWDDK